MCFSATASFGAAAGLGAIGLMTWRQAKIRNRLPIAALPLLFGAQQSIEGVVWLTSKTPVVQGLAATAFVTFSHVLWPTYVPFAVGLLEPPGRRRNLFKFLLLLGAAISIWMIIFVFRQPITASLATGCVVYGVSRPQASLGLALYVIVANGSCLLSSHRWIRLMGLAMAVAMVTTYYAYQVAFYSVWCFFAALLSGIVYLHLRTSKP